MSALPNGDVVVGTVEGTGSAINIELGFVPSYVKVYNYDGVAVVEWFAGMTDGHGLKTLPTPAVSAITSNGISAYDGTSAGFSKGFTIGADTDVNVSAETIYYYAVR